ncbi:MAG TPA: hypothetical protein VGT82_05410, partial [Ktedonobacteraceae bacterium]|nr:hypothetical protein [Ktedonobacteraceae bacterium]
HDLGGFFGTLGHVMGNGPLVRGYEFFLAVLLPLSVGAIALVPLDHFFQHALEQDHLDNHAVLVDERHMHRTRYLKAQRKQKKRIQQAYEAIAQDRANQFRESSTFFLFFQGHPCKAMRVQPLQGRLPFKGPCNGKTSMASSLSLESK